jgi:hypothetical protein
LGQQTDGTFEPSAALYRHCKGALEHVLFVKVFILKTKDNGILAKENIYRYNFF